MFLKRILCVGVLLLEQAWGGAASSTTIRVWGPFKVSSRAAHGTEARTAALEGGEKQALKAWLKEQSAPTHLSPSSKELHDWVVGVEIHHERVSQKAYEATVSYHLDEPSLALWLKGQAEYVAPSEAVEPSLSGASHKGQPCEVTVSFQDMKTWTRLCTHIKSVFQKVRVLSFEPYRGVLSFETTWPKTQVTAWLSEIKKADGHAFSIDDTQHRCWFMA